MRRMISKPSHIVSLDPANHTYHYWHMFLSGVRGANLPDIAFTGR